MCEEEACLWHGGGDNNEATTNSIRVGNNSGNPCCSAHFNPAGLKARRQVEQNLQTFPQGSVSRETPGNEHRRSSNGIKRELHGLRHPGQIGHTDNSGVVLCSKCSV